MAKLISYDEEARAHLKRGIDALADAVGKTLGPKGRNVALDKKYGAPTVTHDGVTVARDIQLARYEAAGMPQIRTNAEAPASLLETIAQPDAQGQKLLRDAAETMHLTARGYHRVLRVARTLADLDGAEKIGRLHLAEALSYRALADDLRRAA